MARNCRFPDLETCGSQLGNQRLLLQGIAGSQKLEFNRIYVFEAKRLFKELRVPTKLETHGSKPEKVTFNQWKDLVDCKKFELMVLNVVLFCLLSR